LCLFCWPAALLFGHILFGSAQQPAAAKPVAPAVEPEAAHIPREMSGYL
jgi:hypothetical protein